MSQETIIIVDFGGMNSQQLARSVREQNVYCEVTIPKKAIEAIKEKKPAGIIFTGGAASVLAKESPDIDKEVYEMGIPILGISYGAHLMIRALGGEIKQLPEVFCETVELEFCCGFAKNAKLFGAAHMQHKDEILSLPKGFEVMAVAANKAFAGAQDEKRRFYAVQFLPQAEQTSFGKNFIRGFLYDVCHCKGEWTTASFVQQTVENIKKTVGDGRVLCALSGGVDSTVCAVLVHKAIGERLNCVFVDHGLMRKNEGDEVMDVLGREFKLNVVRANAEEQFISKLAGVTDPEKKRKIIGAEFIEVFTQEAKKLGEMDFLLQGTIYPDIIESGAEGAMLVKSHHNVGGLPEKLGFKLLEPLRLLFKDEVRKVGTELGISSHMVNRQPFPGPGLAVRCLGEVTREKLHILRESDAIMREEIADAGLHSQIWQYFTVLPNLLSVGVKGEERTYAHAVGIRAVTTTDAMSCNWARIPYDVLDRISSRIVNEVPNVNRVLYDCTTKPPSTIEWE